MSDLAAALRESGHADLARQLEAKELAAKLRRSGRDDLAASLEAPQPPPEQAEAKTPEQVVGEELLGHLNRSVTPWHRLGAGER
jgi:hypothetical protein